MRPRPRPHDAPLERAPERALSRSRAVPFVEQLVITVVVVIGIEQGLRALYMTEHHVLMQRRMEVYGWASMLALLLVLASKWLRLVPYRRILGLFGFGTAAAHTWLAFQHVLDSDLENLFFLTPANQAAVWIGVVSLAGLLPLALTSSDRAMRRLGRRWKALHRLGPPMTLLAAVHTAWIGVHFGLDPLAWTSVTLLLTTLALLAARSFRLRPAS